MPDSTLTARRPDGSPNAWLAPGRELYIHSGGKAFFLYEGYCIFHYLIHSSVKQDHFSKTLKNQTIQRHII